MMQSSTDSETTECSTSSYSLNDDETEETQKKLTIKQLMEKYPNKIPVKINYDKNIPEEYRYYRVKYMVSEDIPIGTFITLLRMKYMKLPSSKAIFYLVNGKHMPKPSETMSDVYHRHKSDDCVVYLSISMENVFGSPQGLLRPIESS